MCGIFGIVAHKQSQTSSRKIARSLRQLGKLSLSRGKDSSGMAFRTNKNIQVLKGDVPVTRLLNTSKYKTLLKEALSRYDNGETFVAMGHARLVTNGSQLHHENNQPVIKNGVICIHNGIITNDETIWHKHPEFTREFKIDTEAFLAIYCDEIKRSDDVNAGLRKAFTEIVGTASVAIVQNQSDNVVLATNNGSLYTLVMPSIVFFASERWYLEQICEKQGFNADLIRQLTPNTACVIKLEDIKTTTAEIHGEEPIPQKRLPPLPVNLQTISGGSEKEVVIDPSLYANKGEGDKYYKLLENNSAAVAKLKRCTKCILPETFPFIEFDNAGTCNYCRNYKPKAQKDNYAGLEKLLAPYRRKDGRPDCMIPFSGGRDSTFTLHLIKKELGMNPIAFTYDWGMVTDLARRNAARVCGKLGVENIIVAADINKKRANIRLNINAWLKNPQLGIVPLFMAGDKYFFYYCNLLMEKNDLDISVWGLNPLENTDFKTGFTGVSPLFGKERIDDLKKGGKSQLALYFVRNFLRNPAYFNTSLFDTLGAFASRYIIKRRGYLQLFDYIAWTEDRIDNVLREYDWEKAIDSPSTWRIGDGTAAFYNYIYYTVAGFSEFDTFRSNQVREGHMSRSEALDLVALENRPRYENIRWYLDIAGVDFIKAIRRINEIPKLYPQV